MAKFHQKLQWYLKVYSLQSWLPWWTSVGTLDVHHQAVEGCSSCAPWA
jgi:hypothetical protein